MAHTLRAFHQITEPDRNLWATQASAELTNLGYTLPVFRNIRYLFVNLIIRRTQQHAILLVISPQAQTIEILDSAPKPRTFPVLTYYEDYARLLNVHYGREFIPSQWKMRENHSVLQGQNPSCVMYAHANAMCLAFGYDLKKLPARSNMLERRLLLARELWNGRYESDPNSRYYFPIVSTEPDNDIKNGWRDLSPAVMASLPIEVRARKGKYRGPAWRTKASVTRHCRNNLRKYRGFTTWSRRPLAEYIEQVEVSYVFC